MPKVYAPTQESIMQDEIDHMNLSRQLAGECVVLMENDGTLPIAPGKIALFGGGARQTVKGGTGSGDVNTRSYVTIEEGLEDAGFTITSKAWLDRRAQQIADAKADYQKMLAKLSEETGESAILLGFRHPYKEPEMLAVEAEDIDTQTDTAIYVISRNSGEGADRWNKEGDYLLDKGEEESLKVLAKAYRRVILILNIGGVMDLSKVKQIEGIGAVVLMSQLGNIGGLAIADVLTGKANPSGKLSDTWAASYSDYPSSATFSHNNGDVDDDNYAEGIYVGYRWFDTAGVKPLYPFGYGLSYTTFDTKPGEACVKDGKVYVTAKVTNTGSEYEGREVVQVYVSAPEGELDKPYQELKGYCKTQLLAPGASQTVTVEFPLERLASYSEKDAAWVLEKGDYIIRVGSSSADTEPAAILRLDETVKTMQVKNVFAPDNEYEKFDPRAGAGAAKDEEYPPLPVISLNAEDIKTCTVTYKERQEYHTDKTQTLTLKDVMDGNCTVEELVSQLSIREMASLAVGAQRITEGASIIGNASEAAPGAAGETSAILKESRGIRSLVMADGPAGLRLQTHFKTRKDGTLLPGGQMFGDTVAPFPEYDNPEDVEDHYQYCTAIPIGWALAQSWNYDLVKQAADMVGAEMEKFGIDIWLAPAMNIHRNPLCGRNFEYYSEDPVLSGLTATAITEGIQAHRGKGVSIKHFAANNQEDNRYCTNAHISERAMREIYLRGFEICIRASQPMTIMTSYNLINGIHTANSYDLLETVARQEWGYTGCVMTDWFSTTGLAGLFDQDVRRYEVGSMIGAIYAGNDIQMPGSQEIEDAIVEGVESGKADAQGFRASLADLQFCAANVIRCAIFADGQ